MNDKKILVNVLYDKNKHCERVSKVLYVSEKEYNALKNEQEKYLNEQEKKELYDKEWKTSIVKHIHELTRRDFLLAKSLYDNFVDLGYINDNAQFQQDFYDFIFNDKDLVVDSTPNDFQIILRKVGNL